MSKKEIITLHKAVVGIDEVFIKNISISLFSGDKVGVIGKNGSGKTTFLRSLAEDISFFDGSYFHDGSIVFVPQIKQQENGLSGGEITKKVLQEAFIKNPEILLLDEPTNHLDIHSKKELIDSIQKFKGVLICISHDTWFLGQITNKLLIIENNQITTFTGSYSDFQEEKVLQEGSKKRKQEVVLKQKRKLDQLTRSQQRKTDQSKNKAKNTASDKGVSRMEIGNKKNKIENISSKQKKINDVKKKQIQTELDLLKTTRRKKVSGIINQTQSQRNIFKIENTDLFINDKQIQSGISCNIESGQRVALIGKNGSGKSSLVKAVLGYRDFILNPKPKIAQGLNIKYLDQHYSFINLEKTVLQNALDFTIGDIEKTYQQLSHFLFDEETLLYRKAKLLSGGMLARLAFVMLTLQPIDLLILDEPTNNLDQETMVDIIEILSDYHGAMIVISHDVDFLEKLKINQIWEMGETFKKREIIGDLW